jgi:poly(A) polymerase/tRNA nucleotidyltransferase (CCA-adding enzyme)
LPDARVVGGAVRDVLAGRPYQAIADIDLASPLPPTAVTEALQAAGLRVVPTGLGHGTVTAVSDGRGFEITTLRHDLETDGRHAVVGFTTDWRADAARRDFTINALSVTRDGEVFDYFNGIADLRAGRVRFVGDAEARIREDYLRIPRFFRFQARYARVPPDPDTLAALRDGIPGLAHLSAERVRTELYRILAAPDPVAAVRLMHDLGILNALAPDLAGLDRLAALQAAGAPVDPVLRLAALLTGDATVFAERLKLSNDDRDRLLRLFSTPRADPSGDDAALRRLLADHAFADLIDRTWLDGGPDRLRQRLATLPVPVFPLEGRDVLALGIPPGPVVGALLRAIRQWWLAGGCAAGRSACQAELALAAEHAKMIQKR